jgi:sulfur-carrier protein
VSTIGVALPPHLRTLARVDGELRVDVAGDATIRAVLDAVEARYPVLRGTIRDHRTLERRAYIRYYAAGDDVSFAPPDARLPDAVVACDDVFVVIGAISGG